MYICCLYIILDAVSRFYETHLVNGNGGVLGTEPPDCQRSGQMQAAIQCGMLRRKFLSQRRTFFCACVFLKVETHRVSVVFPPGSLDSLMPKKRPNFVTKNLGHNMCHLNSLALTSDWSILEASERGEFFFESDNCQSNQPPPPEIQVYQGLVEDWFPWIRPYMKPLFFFGGYVRGRLTLIHDSWSETWSCWGAVRPTDPGAWPQVEWATSN